MYVCMYTSMYVCMYVYQVIGVLVGLAAVGAFVYWYTRCIYMRMYIYVYTCT